LRNRDDPKHPRARARQCLLALTLVTALLALAGCGSTHATSSPAPSASSALTAIGAGLHGPPGLSATVYAKGPATTAAFAFDSRGRLWLTAAGLTAHTEDGVYLIAHPHARAVRVVSGLDDPLGLAWYHDKLYVASVGRVDEFGGFNGKHFTQHKQILSGPALGSENNLLVMSPGGRFIMGVTASCDHCLPKSVWSGSIVSFKPNGSDLRLYAKRIRAPFGFAYFPGTSDLFVSLNQRDDLGARTPGDSLALIRAGQNWRSPTCYDQGGAACEGVPRPIAVLDKHAAVGAVVILTGQLGARVGTAALLAEWQSAKVQQVSLAKAGATYTGSVSPFLTGIQNPLALALAPDHSLLVGDWATGTIYRIAPSSAS
jgi:glucose/arabinose dehydrogenase